MDILNLASASVRYIAVQPRDFCVALFARMREREIMRLFSPTAVYDNEGNSGLHAGATSAKSENKNKNMDSNGNKNQGTRRTGTRGRTKRYEQERNQNKNKK